MKVIPVILSGGSGTRLWPLSRKDHPKQYLSLIGKSTMLQETILRLEGLDNLDNPIIICNNDHRFIVSEQCKQINIANPTIILEPVGRNTAPAIAAAAFQSLMQSDNSILIILSTDHVIQDVEKFQKSIRLAIKQAKDGKLVTFGVVPKYAHTGFGYIKLSGETSRGVFNVEKFFEKPDLQTAQSFIEKGNFLWNCGIFAFQAKTLIDELKIHSSEIVKSVKESLDNATKDLDFIHLEAKSFTSSPSDSIDIALMEKSSNVVVVPLDLNWSDIGSWSALHEIGVSDIDGNVILGDVFTAETSNTYISANHHLVATIGIKNLVIVDTPNATLIACKDKTEEVNKILDQLEEKNRDEQYSHRKVYRPWGWYDSIESGENFQVKRLHINPKSKLSLQAHKQRAEHWVVVSGTAYVINGKEVLTLNKGESTYIPLGVKHSLENKTTKPLEIIEVQSGSYLGEDDITRYEDIYGRE
jgi:mannose-1-phosphate guanylyltransferase/mannose-6-phosphate isomerase